MTNPHFRSTHPTHDHPILRCVNSNKHSTKKRKYNGYNILKKNAKAKMEERGIPSP